MDQVVDSDGIQEKGFQLNSNARRYLNEIGNWTMFFAILGIVTIVIMVVFSLFIGTILGRMPMQQSAPVPPALFSIIYIAIAAFYVFPVLYLFRFSKGIKKSLRSGDEQEIAAAIGYLKSHFKFVGVVTIVILSLYVVAILFGIGAAMMVR